MDRWAGRWVARKWKKKKEKRLKACTTFRSINRFALPPMGNNSQPQLHYTTLQLQLHNTTLNSAVVGDVKDQIATATIATSPIISQLQPPFAQSVDSLCHPCLTTTNLSSRFPILKLPPPPCAVLLVKTMPAISCLYRQMGIVRFCREQGQ